MAAESCIPFGNNLVPSEADIRHRGCLHEFLGHHVERAALDLGLVLVFLIVLGRASHLPVTIRQLVNTSPVNLSPVNLSPVNLSHVNLSPVNLSHVNLSQFQEKLPR